MAPIRLKATQNEDDSMVNAMSGDISYEDLANSLEYYSETYRAKANREL